MKQSAAKMLGAAALGAAFAAAAAGSASAASLPDASSALEAVEGKLPVAEALSNLPAGTAESAKTGRQAIANGTRTALPLVGQQATKALPSAEGVGQPSGLAQATGLLGGLPLNGVPLGS